MRTLTIASLLATVFFSMPCHAQDARSANTDRAKWLSIPEVHARLESAGYRNIEKIERESGSYEVKATDQAGRRIKLYVHPQTGEVIDQRQRDVKRDKYDGGYTKNNQRNAADCNERRCRDDLPQPGTIQPAAGK
ncbi:MAG: PepSY domain-containing protein [Chromatiales bacterium]|nr:PepSY domain-containing protein [Chromatiales bacterium]